MGIYDCIAIPTIFGNLGQLINIFWSKESCDRVGLVVVNKIPFLHSTPSGSLAVEDSNNSRIVIQIPYL